MKEKVKQLAGGSFEYESPALLLSEEELIITVDAGGCHKGSILVENTMGTVVQGQLYSSSLFLIPEKKEFSGVRSEIFFTVDGKNLVAGDMIKGELDIVSDSGEGKIPFYITAEPPYLNSSIGRIKDFFHFTNLAKTDWAEAVKLFKSEEFREFLEFRDNKYLVLYDGLRKSRSASQALEEFLVTVRKKTPINIIVDKNTLEYEVDSEGFMDKVTLMKDNWGYEEIRVTCDGDFIIPEHKIIWSDYFVGNTYPLEFVIQPLKMRRGKNYGRLILSSIHDTIVVEITAVRKHEKVQNHLHARDIRKKIISWVRNYLDFRENRLTAEDYVRMARADLQGLKAGDKKNLLWYRLLEVHLLQMEEGRSEEAGTALTAVTAEIRKENQVDQALICACFYLKALLDKGEEAAKAAKEEIRLAFRMDSQNFKILWFWLYTDKKFESNKGQALELLREQFYKGSRSPYLYLEALLIYRDSPVLLSELGSFETQVLLFGAKENYIEGELAGQFAYLAGKKREFSRKVFLCLSLLYRSLSDKEKKEDKVLLNNLLTSAVSLLIKGHKRGKKYFPWYQLGVKEQLRITELYEYYLYSYDEDMQHESQYKLPQPVLLYFIYNSSLSDKKKAFLYAYIIKNKEELSTVYRSYQKKIENFGRRMLKEHAIDRNFSVIYEELILLSGLTEEMGKDLACVMFKQELGCNNNGIKAVITVHAQTGEEVYTPLSMGSGVIDIYTENYEIFLVDNQDNRYSKTIAYTLYPFLGKDGFLQESLKYDIDNPMVLLNFADKIETYQKFDARSVEIRRKLLERSIPKESYRSRLQMELISYYYDNFQGDLLEEYLTAVSLASLDKKDRIKVIELLINRNFYREASQALKEYGFEGIQINRLLKLCSWILTENGGSKEDFLTALCFFIYKAGKYNEELLVYLTEFYEGATRELYGLWEAACGFEINTCTLEERLLEQMLLTREYLVNSPEVFLKYYQRGCNRKLIRAFLSFHGYKYLINGRILKPALFQVMKRELIYEENDVCMLALLKKLSEEDCFDESEKEFIDYNLGRFLRKGIVLPFFRKFKGVILLNSKITDRYFVEYISNPGARVLIHYRLENGEENFTEEEMRDMFLGIRVKEFVLFGDESLQYYISEGEGEQMTITESGSLRVDQELQWEEDTPYDQINFIVTALEMNDYESVLDSMENYDRNRYLMKDLFKRV